MILIPKIRPEGRSYLFNQSELDAFLRERGARLGEAIERLPDTDVLSGDLVELASSLVSGFRVAVPNLDRARLSQNEPKEVKVDARKLPGRHLIDRISPIPVDATSITFSVPFSGDGQLFRLRASTRSQNPPIAKVGDGELTFTYVLERPDAEALGEALEQELDMVEQSLGWIARDAGQFNDGLEVDVGKQLAGRRDRLLENAALSSALGYPIKRREDAPTTYSVPAKRRRVRGQQPKATSTVAPPQPLDPALLEGDYEAILETIQRTAQIMEYSPRAFSKMGEEDIRWLFLIPLNIAYESATAETFNYEGKTDILIREEGRNIFVAECLIWNGPAYLTEKLTQLLGYTSWRDTKTALLVFNRNKNFTQVLKKIAPTIEKHANHVRTEASRDETWFRFVVSHRDDPERELTLTVLAFDVPTE